MAKNEYICDCNFIHKDIVDDAKNKMIDLSTINKIAEFYKIIGDNTRCKILSILMNNSMCVCDLANTMSMSKSSISHQLNKLRLYKVVKFERKGKEVIYSLEDNHIVDIFKITLEHIAHEA